MKRDAILVIFPDILDCREGPASAPPEVLEARRRQLGVSHRVLDVPMPQIGLQGARVVALVGQCEPAGVAQHVRVDLERHSGIGLRQDARPRKCGSVHKRPRRDVIVFRSPFWFWGCSSWVFLI